MADEQEKPKIGAGHVMGMFRAGLKELTQILPAFPGQGVQPVEEQGIAGNATNIEIVQEKRGTGPNAEYGVHGKAAEQKGQDSPEPQQQERSDRSETKWREAIKEREGQERGR